VAVTVAMVVVTPVATIVVPAAVVATVVVPSGVIATVVVAVIAVFGARRVAVILRPPVALACHGSAGEQRNQKNPNSSAFHQSLLSRSTVVDQWGVSLRGSD
jgi:hypothetical protein